ncbi:MAG TPA: hypothetical protein VEI28_06210 [Thermodesulfovibrionales bacterium]|nr:hypothetical protein [Thermodesulfovibrionales bacterium]
MEKDILGKVIEVEKEIQERLSEERKKAHEWLEGVTKKIEKDATIQEQQLRESYTKDREDSRSEAERKASRIVKDAETLARHCRELSDETLERVVQKYVVRILRTRLSPSSATERSSEPIP